MNEKQARNLRRIKVLINCVLVAVLSVLFMAVILLAQNPLR